jgi:GNAT superfamily N-acetyltransferase
MIELMNQQIPVGLGFGTDLAIRQIEGSHVERGDGFWRIRTPANPTFYWGNFLLLDDVASEIKIESVVALYASQLPNAAHVAIGIDGGAVNVERYRGFRNHGIEVESAAILTASTRDITPGPSPVVVRALESDDDWRQYVEVGLATRESYFEESAYRRYLTDGVAQRRLAASTGRALWLGAFVENELAAHLGIYDCGDGIARYQKIETFPGFQRRGYASALIRSAAQHAREVFDSQTLVIAADPNYHAINLYRSLGFVQTETQLQMQRIAPQR